MPGAVIVLEIIVGGVAQGFVELACAGFFGALGFFGFGGIPLSLFLDFIERSCKSKSLKLWSF